MKRIRGFEIAKGFRDKHIKLPTRATAESAGYDFYSAETITVPSYLQKSWFIGNDLAQYYAKFIEPIKNDTEALRKTPYLGVFTQMAEIRFKDTKPTIVHTGVKAYMQQNECLKLYNRSSGYLKRGLILSNATGIIDADFYSSPKNDGEITGMFLNLSPVDYTVHKGDRIMQGIFEPYLLADNDNPAQKKRYGGLGSTGK